MDLTVNLKGNNQQSRGSVRGFNKGKMIITSPAPFKPGEIIEVGLTAGLILSAKFRTLVEDIAKIENEDRYQLIVESMDGDGLKPQSGSHVTAIKAPAKMCYNAICDFAKYPAIFRPVVSDVKTEVFYPDMRPKIVRLEFDLYLTKMNIINDNVYDDANLKLSWKSVQGSDIASQDGSYSFEERRIPGHREGPLTNAQISIDLLVGFPLPESIIKSLSGAVMKKSTLNLKDYVEKKWAESQYGK